MKFIFWACLKIQNIGVDPLHQGGVTLFYRDSPVLAVKAIRQFGANFIACQLATRERHWYIFGCYLAPGYGTTIREVETAIAEKPRGTELIVTGDLNVDLGNEGERGRDEEIAAAMATEVLETLAGHFFLIRRAWCRDREDSWERATAASTCSDF